MRREQTLGKLLRAPSGARPTLLVGECHDNFWILSRHLACHDRFLLGYQYYNGY